MSVSGCFIAQVPPKYRKVPDLLITFFLPFKKNSRDLVSLKRSFFSDRRLPRPPNLSVLNELSAELGLDELLAPPPTPPPRAGSGMARTVSFELSLTSTVQLQNMSHKLEMGG
jgi:hypothetical protein